MSHQSYSSRAVIASTYTPAPSRPCSPEMFCQKAAPIWLPFTGCQQLHPTSLDVRHHLHTGRSGGEPVQRSVVSMPCFFFTVDQTRGTRAGPGDDISTHNFPHICDLCGSEVEDGCMSSRVRRREVGDALWWMWWWWMKITGVLRCRSRLQLFGRHSGDFASVREKLHGPQNTSTSASPLATLQYVNYMFPRRTQLAVRLCTSWFGHLAQQHCKALLLTKDDRHKPPQPQYQLQV